jgi:hypothetical protein
VIGLRAFGRRFLSLSFSFARFGQPFLTRGLLGDHLRFQRLHECNSGGRCCLRVQINKIAQMEKTRDPRVALVSRLDIVRIVVWLKKHRHSPPPGASARAVTQIGCPYFSVNVRGLTTPQICVVIKALIAFWHFGEALRRAR